MMPFALALQFLTRLPVRLRRAPSAEESAESLLWYPLVGVVLGLLLLLGNVLLSGVDVSLRAALLLAAWVWLSGGLHLDGLADTADAWIGGYGDRERTLAIMKDPACGPIGVLALLLCLLLKYCALALLLQHQLWSLLLVAPWMGRCLLPLLLLTTPYVRAGGLGESLTRAMPRQRLQWVLLGNAVVLLCFGLVGLLAFMTAIVLTLLARRLLLQRLGGTTGDTAGALLEVAECTVLVVAAVVLA
ncbi:MAG: adenosylcobinamide-GDP ribazoletransferase [Halopseudomonas sp.]|uniref:adenosylcobinamide-GDP ribazoletransferase n=1 Tax=Halopseudomonas sp. TaxID=2901191 RepID=UPI003001D899